jgi:hypothetical protein
MVCKRRYIDKTIKLDHTTFKPVPTVNPFLTDFLAEAMDGAGGDNGDAPALGVIGSIVTFFFLITVHVTDYHWDRHLYFVIHPHHAQTMTHTPPSDDSILVHLLVVLVACDSD